MKRIFVIIAILLLPLFLLSCSYYYQLEDEIAKCENKSSGGSIGIGGGRGWGSRGGFGGVGVGASKGIGGCDSDDLRTRRIDVRLALKKRGLNP
ncbi:MAG: hypothetical protein JRJ39_16315 [Deltaproteobacteria bacterium]|nr:hypothetical protein [Deltaproteobacteria bacterium]